jgi:CubicO group peptidase (beta-lactamase class C family)
MKMRFNKGLILKAAILLVFYFWDVAMSSSVNSSISHVLRTENIKPIPHRINNELSDLEDFKVLESGISSLLRKYNIKGASVAVTKQGRLVFAKGVGYADAEALEPVEPRHMFRVASVSKLITAIAIMKMNETGLLDLDDRVFGHEGILNDPAYLDYRDPRVGNITVWHLLNHSGGWNRRFGDHMFMPHVVAREIEADLPVGSSDIIRFALQRRLHFNPGSGSSYSNLGYAILGEIIEKISGLTYEEYVKETILYPLDILDMRIGKNLESDRTENEVKYYEQTNAMKINSIYNADEMVSFSYGGNDIETLGAAGGWIASSAELLKLIVAIDNENSAYKILSDESIGLMTGMKFSDGNPVGWAGTDRHGNWWRTGTFSGTSAQVMRQGNGLSWAVILNSSTFRGTALSREINYIMKSALNRVENWPEHDLFHHLEKMPFLYPDIIELR